MTNNAIASTQKIGEGDAFLFDNSGATRNIEILAKQKAQEAAREQQAKQQKDKQDYDTEKQFYDGLSDIKLDLYEKDVPFINGKIDDIIKKVADEKMAGRNPFDISNSDAYVRIRGELGKLQAWAAASKATKAKVRDLQTALYQDKSGVFDKDKTQAALDAYTAYELPERISLDIQPVQAPFNGQAFLTKNLTPTILKSSLPLQKVYTDKTAQAEAQAQLDNLKVQYTPIVDQFLLSTGRYKPEEIPEQRDKYLESLQFKALYDDKQDVSEAFKAQKQAEDLAIKKSNLSLSSAEVQYKQQEAQLMPYKLQTERISAAGGLLGAQAGAAKTGAELRLTGLGGGVAGVQNLIQPPGGGMSPQGAPTQPEAAPRVAPKPTAPAGKASYEVSGIPASVIDAAEKRPSNLPPFRQLTPQVQAATKRIS